MGLDVKVFGEQLGMMLSTDGGDPGRLLQQLHVVMAFDRDAYMGICRGLQASIGDAYRACREEHGDGA